MSPVWLNQVLLSYGKGLITTYEASRWIVQHIATGPRLDQTALRELERIPDTLPIDLRDGLTAILKDVIEAKFVFQITTVGGPARRADPENLRMACAALGLLGPDEYRRVVEILGPT